MARCCDELLIVQRLDANLGGNPFLDQHRVGLRHVQKDTNHIGPHNNEQRFVLAAIAGGAGLKEVAGIHMALAHHAREWGVDLRVLHQSTHVPVVAITLQSVWTLVILRSGRYDQILNYVTSMDALFFGISASCLFVLRRRDQCSERDVRWLHAETEERQARLGENGHADVDRGVDDEQ